MPIWMATVKEEDNHRFGQGCGKDALYFHTAGGNIKGEATVLKRYFMYMNVCVHVCVQCQWWETEGSRSLELGLQTVVGQH